MRKIYLPKTPPIPRFNRQIKIIRNVFQETYVYYIGDTRRSFIPINRTVAQNGLNVYNRIFIIYLSR